MIYLLSICLALTLNIPAFLLSKKFNMYISGSFIFLLELVLYVFFGFFAASQISVIVVMLMHIILCFASVVCVVLSYRHDNLLKTQVRDFVIVISVTLMLSIFSFKYINQFVPLMPLSGVVNQLEIVQNTYAGNFTGQLGIVSFLTEVLHIFIKNVTPIKLVDCYIEFNTVVFIYLLGDIIAALYRLNENKFKSRNIGLVVFSSFLICLEFFKFNFMTYIQIIIPITLFFFYAIFGVRRLRLFVIVPLLSLFCFNISNKVALIISAIIILCIFANVLVQRLGLKKHFNCCLLILFGLSVLSAYFLNDNFVETFSRIMMPRQDAIFISFVNMKQPTIIMVCLLLFMIVYQVVEINNISSLVLTTASISLNYFLLRSFANNIELFQSLLFVFFNPVMLCLCFNDLPFTFDTDKAMLITFCLLLYIIPNKLSDNPYYLESEYGFNKLLRINSTELDVYKYLNDFRTDDKSVVKVVSQAPFTKGFVPNVELLEEYRVMATRCQYCDVFESDLHEPNELINIFTYREYAGNQIFIEAPKFNEAAELLFQNNFDFVILKKNQLIEINETWVELYQALLNRYKVIFDNEEFVLLDRIYEKKA